MPFKVISGSTKVVDFGTNRKPVYDFLIVINSNLCRISHRFGDTAAYWSKIANSYPPHPHSTPSLGVTPFEFWDEHDIPSRGVTRPPFKRRRTFLLPSLIFFPSPLSLLSFPILPSLIPPSLSPFPFPPTSLNPCPSLRSRPP